MSEQPFIWLALRQSLTEIIVHSNTKEHIRRLKNEITGRYFMSPAGLIIHVDEHANDGMGTLTIRPDDQYDGAWAPRKIYVVLEDWIERVFEATRVERKVKLMGFATGFKRDEDEEKFDIIQWTLPLQNRRGKKKLVEP